MAKNKDLRGPDVSLFGVSLAVRYREVDVDIWDCRLHQRNGRHIEAEHCGFGTGGSRFRAFEDAKADLRQRLAEGGV